MVTCLQSVGVTWLSQKSWAHNNFTPKKNTSEDVLTSGIFRTRNESNLMVIFTFKISTKFCILLAIKFTSDKLIILVHRTNVSGHGTKMESQKGWGFQSWLFYGVLYLRWPLALHSQVTESAPGEPHLCSHHTFFLCVHLLSWTLGVSFARRGCLALANETLSCGCSVQVCVYAARSPVNSASGCPKKLQANA